MELQTIEQQSFELTDPFGCGVEFIHIASGERFEIISRSFDQGKVTTIYARHSKEEKRHTVRQQIWPLSDFAEAFRRADGVGVTGELF